MKLGFFDSGVGGEYVMEAVKSALPEYEYICYKDTANFPFGEKTEEEIYTITKNGVEHLFEEEALLVVVACNTASAETVRRLQDDFLFNEYPERKVLGVVIPTIEEVLESGKRNILLIGTNRTVGSEKYQREFQKRTMRKIQLKNIPTPDLVSLIESGDIKKAFYIAEPMIADHVEGGGDGLILGCTHYCVLKDQIREKFRDLKVFSQDEIIPKKLKLYLKMHPEIEEKLTKNQLKQVSRRRVAF